MAVAILYRIVEHQRHDAITNWNLVQTQNINRFCKTLGYVKEIFSDDTNINTTIISGVIGDFIKNDVVTEC